MIDGRHGRRRPEAGLCPRALTALQPRTDGVLGRSGFNIDTSVSIGTEDAIGRENLGRNLIRVLFWASLPTEHHGHHFVLRSFLGFVPPVEERKDH